MEAMERGDGRGPGGHHYVKGAPLVFREALEAFFLAHPTAPVVMAALATGASRKVAETVKKRLVAAGRIPPPHNMPKVPHE